MSLRIALLGLLAEHGAASGYDLAKEFELSIANVWRAKHSQIYPELRKMENDGVVTASAEGGRGKRAYTLTSAGERELRRWLVETDPTREVRSEAALRLFLIPLLPSEQAVPLLRAEAMVYDTRSARLRDIADGQRAKGFHNRSYQALMGAKNMGALRDWATAVADDLEWRARPE